MKRPVFLRHFLWLALTVSVAGLFLLWLRLQAIPVLSSGAAPVFSQAKVAIERADGRRISFDMELATTPQQQAYGLMFRRSLPRHAGMLFIFTPDQLVTMWMKNTYIPLDMLFVRADGIVVKIAAAKPLDLTPIGAIEPVRGVIELGGGEATRHGLKTGDKVLYPAFSAP